MNLPVIFSKIGEVAKKTAGTSLLVAKKHAPEIMIGSGIAGFVATIFQTVKATNKTNDILEERGRRIGICDKNPDDQTVDYDDRDLNNDISMINRQTRFNIVKTWAPVATTAIGSTVLILGGYRILNGRYVATAAAYKVLESGYERYRGNVIEEFGKDVDWRMANNIKAEELEAERREREENSELRKSSKKGKRKTRQSRYTMPHSNVFDQYSEHWQRYWTPAQVWQYLKRKEAELNDKLQINKHLFVNEVWDALGLERTPEGQLCGWIITRNHDAHVSLGLDEMPDDQVRKFMSFMNNEDIWIRLNLNPDGMIYQMIENGKDYDRYD